MQLAVLDRRLETEADPRPVWFRYGEELPNFLNVLALARQPGANSERRKAAVTIASALMRYFFVIGPHGRGAQLMLEAAALARSDDDLSRACALLLQGIALAKRADSPGLVDEATEFLLLLEKEVIGSEALADLAMCHAILSEDTTDNADAGRTAVGAYRAYARRLRDVLHAWLAEPAASWDHTHKLDEAHNDLSGPLGAWAMSLLKSGEHARAKRAYLHSMRHQRGEHIDVNRGQTMHQLGNCESHLGNNDVAMTCYLGAADIFEAMGMSGYLSNALGEYGYSLLDATGSKSGKVDAALVRSGLRDLAHDLRSTLGGKEGAAETACMRLLRKTSGMMILASLNGPLGDLGDLARELHKDVVAPARSKARTGISRDGAGFYLANIETALATALIIADIDKEVAELPAAPPQGSIETMLVLLAQYGGGEWGLTHLRYADWISDVITVRWAIDGAGRSEVTAFFEDINFGDPEPLVLSWRH